MQEVQINETCSAANAPGKRPYLLTKWMVYEYFLPCTAYGGAGRTNHRQLRHNEKNEANIFNMGITLAWIPENNTYINILKKKQCHYIVKNPLVKKSLEHVKIQQANLIQQNRASKPRS